MYASRDRDEAAISRSRGDATQRMSSFPFLT